MDDQSMELDEVLTYLRSVEDFAQGPMDTIRAQTEAIGDPSHPTPAQTAALQWLQDAYTLWTTDYPIEEPLAYQLRKLLPVAAALAITDSSFFIPGQHELHRLLDTIHNSAVGWQPRLGRAGQALEQLTEKAVANARSWLMEGGDDLASICDDIVAAAEKDVARAQRMTQRLVAAEKGRLRTASARWKGAEMINRALETHKATLEIGEFLRGPWYESAQLVLLKHGADSAEWAHMGKATETLLDSLKVDETADPDRRQQLFERVTRVPKEVKRWLLSLHMDPEAVGDAIGLIEYTHLRLLRQQDIELVTIEPLQMDGMTADRAAGADLETIDSLEIDQWFTIDEGKGESLRVQLVLKLGQEQVLQFANKAGLKAMQLRYEEFCKLLATDKAVPLRHGASFSICLAAAAGIETEEDIQALTEQTEPDTAHIEQEEARRLEQKQVREQQEAEQAQREQQEAERLQQEKVREQQEAEQAQREQQEAERLQQEKSREQQEAEHAQREQQEAERLQQEKVLEQQEAERAQRERELAEQLLREQQEAERIQNEQQEAEKVRRAHQLQLEQEEADKVRIEAYLERKRQRIQDLEQASEENAATVPAAPVVAEIPEPPPEKEADIQLPMGSWLGFHDGDTPLMAKLAVHDREQDCYIFVNREGIKMRSLNKQELVHLIDNNQVDILEARSNFKDEVTLAKKDLD